MKKKIFKFLKKYKVPESEHIHSCNILNNKMQIHKVILYLFFFVKYHNIRKAVVKDIIFLNKKRERERERERESKIFYLIFLLFYFYSSCTLFYTSISLVNEVLIKKQLKYTLEGRKRFNVLTKKLI